jgi:hypothetical protein
VESFKTPLKPTCSLPEPPLRSVAECGARRCDNDDVCFDGSENHKILDGGRGWGVGICALRVVTREQERRREGGGTTRECSGGCRTARGSTRHSHDCDCKWFSSHKYQGSIRGGWGEAARSLEICRVFGTNVGSLGQRGRMGCWDLLVAGSLMAMKITTRVLKYC